MYKSRFGLVFLLLFTIPLIDLFGQELTVGAQIRPRFEFRNGFKTLTMEGRDPAFFIEQRTRLWADFKTKKFRIMINMQDVRIWGSTSQIYKSDPSLFNVYEAWGEYYFSEKFSMRLGRMALDYNNARFFGNLDWAAQGRSHDALLFLYRNPETQWELHVGGAFNQPAEPPEPVKLSGTLYTGIANYKTMQYVWSQKKFNNTDLSFLFQNDGRQATLSGDTTVTYRQTYAVIANHQRSKFNVGGELYYQGGKNQRQQSISALLASVYFTYKTSLTPLTVGIDYLSGSDLNDTDDKSFDPLYGTNHKFYGFMDYFYVGNFHGQGSNSSGLTDIFVKTNWKLGKISALTGHLHFFSSPVSLYDPENTQNEINKYLGTEIDLVLVIKPVKFVEIDIGYSQMFATSSMEAIKDTPGDHTALNNWAWVMVNFNPILLKKDFSKN